MEALDWVRKEPDDRYSLGSTFAALGNAYFSSFRIVDRFMAEAAATVEEVGETVQLARLERHEIVYMAKKEAPTPVRLISEPGFRMPAYCTALGKVLLSALGPAAVRNLFEHVELKPLTPNTIRSFEQLEEQLSQIRETGYGFDMEEAVAGFRCVAAPVYDRDRNAVAAVSVSMLAQQWDAKRDKAVEAIRRLADQLSLR
jgi:DNA-binding IclR family transcriptional regulator